MYKRQVKETHKVLHGTKVSYGILVQLLAEGKKEEVERLIPFYKENDLAYNLACVNVDVYKRQVQMRCSKVL